MKKFIILLMILALAVGASAKKVKKSKAAPSTYQVEKVFNVTSDGKDVMLGDILSANTVVTIQSNGYLMIVDNAKKKRYFVTKKCSMKVKDLTASTTKPKNVTKYYLEDMMNGMRRSDSTKYGSAGAVERKPIFEAIKGVETDAQGNMEVYMVE